MTRPLPAIEWEEIQRLFRDQNIYNVGISDANEVDDFIKQNFLEYLKIIIWRDELFRKKFR